MTDYFLTSKELVPHVKELIPNISKYTLIEVDAKSNLPEILVQAGFFKTIKEAKKSGFKGKSASGLNLYKVNEDNITLLI
jgi:hypothetical protein